MKVRVTLATAAAASIVTIGRGARAQELDLDRFQAAATYDGFVTVEGSAVRPEQDRFTLGLFTDYAHHLLVVENDGDLDSTIVGGRLSFEATGSVTVIGPFAIGLGIPFHIAQYGDSDPDFAGLGDIRVLPKLQILDDRESVGLGVIAEIDAPTHYGDWAGGKRMIVGWPRLTLDHRFVPSGFRIGTNIGAKLRQGSTYANVEGDSEFTYALALGYRFGGVQGPVELGAEGQGAIGFVGDLGREEAPLEALAYLKGYPHPDWELVGGPGVGAVPGYGVPMFRLYFGFRWAPTSHDKDNDGIPDDEDKCPDVAENRNGIEDLDGCPDQDGDDDVDGIPNSEDDCPDEKETINGVQDEDGCADGGPARVIREDGEIVILEAVHFETGSAQIKPESHSILNQVALVMKANPDIERIRVEGHTDETGDAEVNMKLSKDRAESVRRHLISRGVKEDRVRAEGYGEEKPLETGTDKASLAKNRRVEFKIEQ